jgi:hypothetical protein
MRNFLSNDKRLILAKVQAAFDRLDIDPNELGFDLSDYIQEVEADIDLDDGYSIAHLAIQAIRDCVIELGEADSATVDRAEDILDLLWDIAGQPCSSLGPTDEL